MHRSVRAAGVLLLAAAAIAAVATAPPSDAEQPAGAQAVVRATPPVPLVELVAQGGVGRLYTADPREVDSATAAGLKRQPGQVGFLDRESFTGSTPLFRLKPSSTASKWLFTASTAERDALLAQKWVYEGVAGYVATQRSTGFVQLRRFTNGQEWRLALEDRTADLIAAGYTLDGPVGYVRQNYVRAGAVYFGMFHTGGHQRIIDRTKEIYGRDNDWWGGVRDFHDGTHYATDNWPDSDFSDLKPAIGYYDDSKPETLEKHITQATTAGLSFFNFYWYWNSKTQTGTVTDAALTAFLAARNKDSIDFTVGLCAHPFDGLSIPQAQFGTVATTLTSRFLNQSNTLRTNDGRKILNICDARGLGDGSTAQIKAFVDTVHQTARSQLGEDVYVMINQAGFDPRQVPAVNADAAYCTTDGPGVEGRSYDGYLAGQRAFYQQGAGAYGRCVMSDFDERPRYPIENADLPTIRWFPDQSVAKFRQAIQNVKNDMATSTRPSTVDNLVYVYAWNEWHEGGFIEPSEHSGCAYLDALHDGLALQGPGCISNPAGTPPS
jgi:hypothetical protein